MTFISPYINLEDHHKNYRKLGRVDVVIGSLRAEKQ